MKKEGSRRKSRRIRQQCPEFHGLSVGRVHKTFDTLEHVDLGLNETNGFLSCTMSTKSKAAAQNNKHLVEFYCSQMWVGVIFFLLTGCVCMYKLMDSRSQGIIPLQKMFSNESLVLWAIVEYGKTSKSPFVLMLVHDQLDQTATCLAICIAKVLLMSRFNSASHPVVFDGAENNNDAEFLVHLKTQMTESQALVLLHVDQLHPFTAQKLHFVLDIYSPWIPEGVYVLTMEIPNLSSQKHLLSAVTDVLTKKWGYNISADHLDPLLTRVANSVVSVQSKVDSCPALCK